MAYEYSPVSSREIGLNTSIEDSIDTANWMAAFGHVPGPNLIMPGSHDSGAQDLDCCFTGPDWKQARYFLPLGCCVVTPWSVAQGCDVEELLCAGCRHFDLRIGIDDGAEGGSEDSYRLCHGFFSRQTLADILHGICCFLNDHPTEAVLLEVKGVMSFNDSVGMEEHDVLIAFMEDRLGGKDAFVSERDIMRPLGDLVGEGKRVFMVYCPGGWGHPGESPVDNHKDTMLPGYCLRSKWPNLCDPSSLRDFIGDEIDRQCAACHDKFLILQCVMTPGILEVVKGALCGCLFDRGLWSLALRLEPELCAALEAAPRDQLSHGAVFMIDWLDAQPELVDRIIRINLSCHS